LHQFDELFEILFDFIYENFIEMLFLINIEFGFEFEKLKLSI